MLHCMGEIPASSNDRLSQFWLLVLLAPLYL